MNLKSLFSFSRQFDLAHKKLFAAMVAGGLVLMANTPAVCNSFKTELFNGHHALGTSVVRAGTGADTIKAALYLTTATITKSTTAYSSTNELAASGNYTAGGVTVTNANAPANASDITYWTPSASLVWTTLTSSGSFDTVLFYNSTQSNKAIASYGIGTQNVTAANLTLSMPTNDQTTGLLRLA